MKRILSVILFLAMVISLAPVLPASASGVVYTAATTLSAGAKIVLVAEYNGSHYAMANDTSISNALGAVEVTVVNDTVNFGDADVVWEVVEGGADGTFRLRNSSDQYISWSSSTSITLGTAGVDLTISCGKGTSSAVFSSTASESTVRALFFRDNGGALQFRAYSMANATQNGYSGVLTIYAMSEHDHVETAAVAVAATCTTAGRTAGTVCSICGAVLTGCEEIAALGHNWVAGTTVAPTCGEEGYATYACSRCGAVKVETIPATGEHNFVYGACTVCGAKTLPIADSLAVGDQIVLVAAYNDKYYAMTSDNATISKSLTATEVTVSGDEVIFDNENLVWEVVAGSAAGTFQLKSGDGRFLSWTSSTSVVLTNAGTDLTVSCGNGTSSILLTSTLGQSTVRGLFFHDSGNTQFRFYGIDIAATPGYSGMLTIFSHRHTWIADEIVPATCTDDGYTLYTCSGCGETKQDDIVAAPGGHDWGIGTLVAATATTHGYTLYACSRCDATKQENIVHHYVNGVCTVCGTGVLSYHVVNSLAAGDHIVLVAEYNGKYYAMANDTSISSNALGAMEVTVINDTVDFGDADVVWEVNEGGADGTFRLRNSSGQYISWSFGTSITLGTAGVDFTVTCGAGASSLLVSAERGILFRDNGGALQFRAYSMANATQNGFSGVLTIFSKSHAHDFAYTDNGNGTHTTACTTCDYSEAEAHTFENGVCTFCGAADPIAYALAINTASLTLYEDIVVNFTATVPEGMTDPYMVVELDGQSSTLTASREDAQGRLVFEFMNLTPDKMGDNIKATLYATAPGGQLVHFCKPEYSVKQYCTNVMAAYPDDAKLQTLLSDILVYGAATQRFTGHNADTLVTDGLTLDAASAFEDLTSTDFGRTGTQDADIQWTGAGLECGSRMSMYFTLNTTVGEATSVEVTINGRTTVYSYSDMTVVDENDFGATCRVVFRGISASEYGDVVTAVLKNNGEQVGQTLTYSVNSYVYSKQHDTNTENLAQLVRAIYNYGKSAKNYLN